MFPRICCTEGSQPLPGGGGLLDVLAPQPTHVERGNEVLGADLPPKDVSRAVAQNAASRPVSSPRCSGRCFPSSQGWTVCSAAGRARRRQ
jgi:hypothetical protein